MGNIIAPKHYFNSNPSIGSHAFHYRTKLSIPIYYSKPGNVSFDINNFYKEFFPPPKKKSCTAFNLPKRKRSDSKDLVKNQDKLEELEENVQFATDKNTNPNTPDLLSKSVISDRVDLSDETCTRDIEDPKINIKIRKGFDFPSTQIGDGLRKSYIAKLIFKKVWQPKVKKKDHNSLIIFDWDDTLLCTTFLSPNGIIVENMKMNEKDIEIIQCLDTLVSTIIRMAISKGETYIITNAAPGWVEYSAKRYYPGVFKFLKNVTIISARGVYEKHYPGDCRQWKILAFSEVLNNINPHLVTNLICFGDSVIEIEAAHALASQCNQAYIKTIKFLENPKPEELYKQLGLIFNQFEKIFSSVNNLTMRIKKKGKAINTK